MLVSMRILFSVLVFSVFVLPAFVSAFALDEGRVRAVIDGDTIVVDGHSVRLLAINTPEKARDDRPAEPGAGLATRTLKSLISGSGTSSPKVTLVYDGNKTDRYDRLLAHVYLPDGTWLNKALLDAGVAQVYSFPDNRRHLRELLKAEAEARKAQKGTWGHETWQVLEAETLTPDTRIGQFRLVEGTPLKAARVNDRVYLNYGADWRTDFTVEIPEKFLGLFEEEGIDPLTDYPNKKLRVRGRLKPVNGVLITVTHPEQIRILTDSN